MRGGGLYLSGGIDPGFFGDFGDKYSTDLLQPISAHMVWLSPRFRLHESEFQQPELWRLW
jgi:hypothetical protein